MDVNGRMFDQCDHSLAFYSAATSHCYIIGYSVSSVTLIVGCDVGGDCRVYCGRRLPGGLWAEIAGCIVGGDCRVNCGRG